MVDEISRRFVPHPSRRDVLADACVMLKRLRHTLRWKEFFHNNPELQQANEQSLGTGVAPARTIQLLRAPPKGSRELESFIDYFTRSVFHNLRFDNEISTNSQRVQSLLKQLNNMEDTVAVSTDKTNSYKLVKLNDYQRWINDHIAKSNATEISDRDLENFRNASLELFLDAKSGERGTFRNFPLSRKESQALQQQLEKRPILTPFLLIKDHKKANDLGEYPTRLVIPAQNFNSIFA